jgi:hypothetical protein
MINNSTDDSPAGTLKVPVPVEVSCVMVSAKTVIENSLVTVASVVAA